MKKIAGTAFVLLWMLTIVLVLLWDQNLLSILACALGLTASLLVIFRLRWWRPVGVSASLLFVVNWALAFIRIGGDAPLEAYATVVQSATQGHALMRAFIVLGYEVLLPLLHLVAALALLAGLVKRDDP